MAIVISEVSDEDLRKYLKSIENEIQKRNTLRDAEAQMKDINVSVLKAKGVTPGDPWIQPTGAHDAYPKAWTSKYNDKLWESLVDNNVWEPGVSGWREKPEEGEIPEWVRPTGAHDAYSKDNLVLFEDQIYKSLMDGNVWSPYDYPDAWELQETPE